MLCLIGCPVEVACGPRWLRDGKKAPYVTPLPIAVSESPVLSETERVALGDSLEGDPRVRFRRFVSLVAAQVAGEPLGNQDYSVFKTKTFKHNISGRTVCKEKI